MDIKLKKSKLIILFVICVCISTISFNIENITWMLESFSSSFYKSIQIEEFLYTSATNSVYTVVGNNASDKMLEYREDSTKILDGYKSSNIFVKNNDSQAIYSNSNINNFELYKNKTKDYPYIIEINFKDNT
ncbi:MAG: hypothetical protein ACRDD7_07345, partial [Peptostreptococcaceae bacterium]